MNSLDSFPILESEKLDELKGINIPGEEPLFLTLLGIFFRESPPLYENLIESLKGESFADIQRYSHKLGGSCGIFGGLKMTEICRQIERCSIEKSLEGARAMLPALQAAYAEISEALKVELEAYQ